MRTFELVRQEDVTGVSGTGVVAYGVRFDDGQIMMRWATAHRSTTVYENIQTLIKIHGHEGKTLVRWLGAFGRGLTAAVMDDMENVLTADKELPKFMREDERDEFIAGYTAGYNSDPEYTGSYIHDNDRLLMQSARSV
jgi:hypothetical protein